MIRFIENIGDYFSQHFFDDGFEQKVFDRSGYVKAVKDKDGKEVDNHISAINKKVSPLSEKYFRFKNEYLQQLREKDRVKLTHDFHTEVLRVLGYTNQHAEYEYPIYLNENEVIPVRYRFTKGDKPYLYVMEMKAMIKQGEKDANGIYDQIYLQKEWESVFPESWKDLTLKPDVINEALSELFLLPEDQRPEYVILLAGPKLFLIHYEKWKYDSFLLFDMEELFSEAKGSSKNYLSLFYALLAKKQFISDSDSILHTLEEDAHKAAYGVTQTLKNGVIFAVENLANEAIHYKLKKAKDNIQEQRRIIELRNDPDFARELKEDCLTFVYRLLFIFYAESREDLEILPVKDATYLKGYSMEMLRDLEMVELKTESSREGTFFSESLWMLFKFMHEGYQSKNGFHMKPIDSPIFDNSKLKHLIDVQFRNVKLKEIILKLSLSDGKNEKGSKQRGRISYANLGINQLGSVYESLLAYSGFFAKEDLIEVKAAKDKTGKEGTFLVPKSRRDDFTEDEILKDPENPSYDKNIEKGKFVYRLNGRDRKKSASFYTPEVLTQCTVKYTLKGIIEKLKKKQNFVDGELKGEECADEILNLKILEPAMGAAAFHNEVINQLAVIYLELKENEELAKGHKRITPGNYNNELQKVKAYIASNNVYGVDLNPTAVELGKLSLWLNCMHKEMETPFFAHRLGVGNAVVGAWLKTYHIYDCNTQFPTTGTQAQRNKPIPKAWWKKAPKRVQWNKQGKLNRDIQNDIYHFLLPDKAMVASFNNKMLKAELSKEQKDAFTAWRKDFCAPLNGEEIQLLLKISRLIDALLEEHYQKITIIARDTASQYELYGTDAAKLDFKNYADKERLIQSRNNRSGAYYKLRTIMDYWCALWFWDAREIHKLPTRQQWYNELINLIGLNLDKFIETDSVEKIQDTLKAFGVDTSTLFSVDRIDSVQKMQKKYRFFHNELEFIEVFKERGGFDVIVGNPPWIKLKFEEKDLVSETFPELEIRKVSAPQVRKMQTVFLNVDSQKETYLSEVIDIEASAEFMNAKQNYPLLVGQQTNLYKCVLENGFNLTAKQGFLGLIHPEGVYDDPMGQPLRKAIYKRLNYHFQFQNELNLFAEVHHVMKFGIQIFKGLTSNVNFISISNLFNPSTVDNSFIHQGKEICQGIKVKDEITKSFLWNIEPHSSRIVFITERELDILAKTFEDSNKWESAKLVSIHAKEIMSVLEKLGQFPNTVNHFENKISEGWHETNDVNNGYIQRHTQFPDVEQYEMIYSGPHFYVANPLYKTPKEVCKLSSDYDNVLLTDIKEGYISRTNYIPQNLPASYESTIKGFKTEKLINGKPEHDSWFDYYKIGFRKMLGLPNERTLFPAILPPKTSHVNGVISITIEEEPKLIELSGLSSSLIYDFFVKTIGATNLTESRLKTFPLGVNKKYIPQLFVRTLQLNCLNKYYSTLWERNWQEDFKQDSWSKADSRLKSFISLTKEWQWKTPLRNWYERRMALVEVDVITAIALGLSLEELILIYNVQFPVLQQNEDDTWYDAKGNIVFTCSKGLTGVGVDRKQWNEIKDLPAGKTYTHTITKSELYNGKQLTYYAPFDKCDRVEDYKTAWAHFEKVFNK